MGALRTAAARKTARRAAQRAAQRAEKLPTPTAFDLDQMLDLQEAAALVGLSRDSLKRHYPHLIRRLTPGRVGIRVRDVLGIGNPNAPAA
jgi:hypothetical protein